MTDDCCVFTFLGRNVLIDGKRFDAFSEVMWRGPKKLVGLWIILKIGTQYVHGRTCNTCILAYLGCVL